MEYTKLGMFIKYRKNKFRWWFRFSMFFKELWNLYYHTDNIKVFGIKGNKIREINDSNEDIFYIYTYYDKQLSKKYIITGSYSFIKSFDCNYIRYIIYIVMKDNLYIEV